MADPSPLLSDSNSTLLPEKETRVTSLEDAIEECIGSFGWMQLFQAMLVSFAEIFDGQQTFISVFTEAAPSWHCTDTEFCHPGMNQCELPNSAWAWDQPVETSLLSEWDLECAGPFVSGLPTSCFFMGCIVGGLLLGTLADSSLGRKKMLLLSCLVMSLTSALTTFSPNIWIYSMLRFITGFGRATIGTSALVLSTELVGKKWRGEVGMIGFFCFTFGVLSLPAMAYLNKASSWRMLYLWTSLPAILYSTLVYFTVYESPRWLFVQGRKDEAIEVLRSISSTNNQILTFSEELSIDVQTRSVDLYSGVQMLWERSWAFQRLLSVMIAGFGMGMVYYGMPLGVGNLKFNLYWSMTLNALLELPAVMITFFLIGRLNRRNAVLVLSIVSGVCSVMCVVIVHKGFQIGLELVSFFSVCAGFGVLLIYTLELFPTCVRNTALSMVRQALVLGGVFCPVLIAAGRKDGFLSYGVFGLVIGICGLFVVCLPDTRGESLCDTMDEQENKEVKVTLLSVTAVVPDGGV